LVVFLFAPRVRRHLFACSSEKGKEKEKEKERISKPRSVKSTLGVNTTDEHQTDDDDFSADTADDEK
jgi:hypothetical protein